MGPISNPAVLAPSESLHGQYPGGSQALSTPRRRRELFGLLGLISASVQSCSARHPGRSWLGSPGLSSHLQPSPVELDISLLAVAGSRPATDQSAQEAPPRPMASRSGSPWPMMRSISAREMRPDEPKMNRPFQQRAAAADALQQAAGLRPRSDDS
jgi:hypothetical protein